MVRDAPRPILNWMTILMRTEDQQDIRNFLQSVIP